MVKNVSNQSFKKYKVHTVCLKFIPVNLKLFGDNECWTERSASGDRTCTYFLEYSQKIIKWDRPQREVKRVLRDLTHGETVSCYVGIKVLWRAELSTWCESDFVYLLLSSTASFTFSYLFQCSDIYPHYSTSRLSLLLLLLLSFALLSCFFGSSVLLLLFIPLLFVLIF